MAVAGLIGCQSAPIVGPGFDGVRAYGYLERQVAFGPRVPGSRAWELCRGMLRSHFEQLGFKVDSQAVSFQDPYSGENKPLVNLIVHVEGKDNSPLPIMLATHWDSRPRCDNSPDPARRADSLPGANDGASGVAVLMELGNAFAKVRPARNVDLVLLDGEDWGQEGDMKHYFLGAQYLASTGVRDKYLFGILIDMIGDSAQQIYRESYSESFHKPLNDMVWSTAKKLGITTFIDSVKYAVMDDHLPISAAGLPMIDLIDFDYPYWHTEMDTPDKCSATALTNVGRVLEEVAYDKALWPTKP
jgi:glutaminyl-peptide cyclotransferase